MFTVNKKRIFYILSVNKTVDKTLFMVYDNYIKISSFFGDVKIILKGEKQMKKALSLVLTMCIVLSLFATFVVSASAEEAVVSVGATYTATAKTHDYGDWAGWS